jgi:Family of unknown function (DUF6353)
MKLVPEAISRTVARNALLVQKGSPGLLLGAGIVGMVGTTVLASRATLKMDTVLDEAKDKLETAKTLEHPKYSEKDRGRDVTLIYFQTGVKIAKLYAPAVVVGGLSIFALTSSHRILTRRNAALTAAYGALDRGFREYRARVVDKYGEEEDRNLRYGTRDVQIIDEQGAEKTVTRVATDALPSIYARFFDSYSTSWSKEPEYNLIFLRCQQNYANDLLRSRGHVFLNEVYDMLGIQRSKAGAVVGWLLSPNGSTDNFINFGVFDGQSDKARDFVNGIEGSILLDFNVDGVIYDKIDSPGEELQWQLGH